MTNFTESEHPRAAAGTFTDKVQTAAELSLAKPNLSTLPVSPEVATAVGAIAAGGHNGLLLHDKDSAETVEEVVAQIALAAGDKHVVSIDHTATVSDVIAAMKEADGGILFLVDAPEFAGNELDLLRQPMESGVLTIARANEVTHSPANFTLILGGLRCPCGEWGKKGADCTCAPFARRRYLARLSGPIVDRMDVQVSIDTDAKPGKSGTSTEEVVERATRGRAAAAARLEKTPWTANSQVSGAWLRGPQARLSTEKTAQIDRMLERGALTMRGYDRALRLAWTLADEAGRPEPTSEDIIEAVQLRQVNG
jgi:predicted ATPase with chaperone activity